MSKLEIINLCANVGEKQILKGSDVFVVKALKGQM